MFHVVRELNHACYRSICVGRARPLPLPNIISMLFLLLAVSRISGFIIFSNAAAHTLPSETAIRTLPAVDWVRPSNWMLLRHPASHQMSIVWKCVTTNQHHMSDHVEKEISCRKYDVTSWAALESSRRREKCPFSLSNRWFLFDRSALYGLSEKHRIKTRWSNI